MSGDPREDLDREPERTVECWINERDELVIFDSEGHCLRIEDWEELAGALVHRALPGLCSHDLLQEPEELRGYFQVAQEDLGAEE